MAKYEDPNQLDYRNGGDTVDDFAQKYMRTIAYVFKALNDLRTPTGNTAGVTPEPYMWRIADNKLYIRNADNTDYILLGDISPNFGFRQSVNDRFLTTADLEGDGAVVTRNEAGKVEGDITGSPGRIAGKTIDVTPSADNDVIAYDAAQQKWVKKTLNDYLKKQGDAGWDEMVDEVADQVIEDITPIIFNFWYLDDDGYLVPLVGSTEGGMPSIHGMVGDYEQITARSVEVAGNLSATGNVTAGMLTTPQANVTTLTANAVNAGTLTANDTPLHYVFTSVSDMVNANLRAGMTCRTNGYYIANDNGGAVYKIREKITGDITSETADGSTSADLLILLQNGLVAELQCNGLLNARQIGCGNEGTTINNDALITAIKKGNSIFFPAGNYYLSSTLYLNYDFTIKCDDNAVFYPVANINWMVYIGDVPLTIPGRGGSHSRALSGYITYSWEGGNIDCQKGDYAAQSGLCSAKSYHSVVRDLVVVHPTDKGIGITGASSGAYSLFDNIVVRCEKNATHANYGFYINEYDQSIMRCSVINCKVGFYTTKQNVSFYQCTAWMVDINGWEDTVCFHASSTSTNIRYYNCMVDTMHIGFQLDNKFFKGAVFGLVWMNNSAVNNQSETHKYCTLVTAPNDTTISDSISINLYEVVQGVGAGNTFRKNLSFQQSQNFAYQKYIVANRDRFDANQNILTIATEMLGFRMFAVKAGATNAPETGVGFMCQSYCWDVVNKYGHITAAGFNGSFYVGKIENGAITWTAK